LWLCLRLPPSQGLRLPVPGATRVTACYATTMLSALIVGALTAWYLGVRAGVVAAGITAVALLAAMVVPGMTLAVYALVLAWCGALYFLGAKLGKTPARPSWLGQVPGQATSWVRKLFGKG